MTLGLRGSKNNTTDTIIDFEVYFNIFSNSYKKWAKINFPDLALIGGGYVPSDTTPLEKMDLSLQPSFGYNFVKLDNQLITNDIFRLYSDHDEKYFEINESWIKISSNDSIKGYRKIDSLIMAGENLRAFELAESIYNRYINDYGSEENIDVRLKQSFQMTKSRMEYLKK